MNKLQIRGVTAGEPDEDSIVLFLKRNPDFFVQHESLLTNLRLPHVRGSATVSLVERQVEVLRDKNQNLERKLADFVRVARANDLLAEKIHRFTRRLLSANGRAATVLALEKSLREDFEAFESVLVLFGKVDADLPAGDRFLRRLEPQDHHLASFETLFTSGKPRCGQIRDSQRDFLFGSGNVEIGSVALVPLGGKAAFGLLALGSPDRDRFHPGMSTEFLGRMAELVSDALGHS
ncbi:MAG: DUF484 family protein [Steroidobacteraceae bacterium]